MIKDLVNNDAILSIPCEAATAEDADLAQDLADTLLAHDDAACLAANQIGVTKAAFAYLDEKDAVQIAFNPKILMGMNASKTAEGCLTRETDSKVTRYQKVKATYDELIDGQLKPRKRDIQGWQAQIFQHMVDHCKGKLV